MAKIFVRERRHVGQGDSRPRFAIVGVEGSDLKFFKSKVRQAELETIAQTIGADVVMLPRGSGEHNGGKKERGRKRQKDKG